MIKQRYTKEISYYQLNKHDSNGNCPELIDPKHEEYIEKYGINRASGLCSCDVCGNLYYDHPKVVGMLWLVEICDGSLYKL